MFLVDADRMLLKFNVTITRDTIRGNIIWTSKSVGRTGRLLWSAQKEK